MFNIDVKKKGNKKNLYIITVYVFNNNFTLLYFTCNNSYYYSNIR